MVIRRTGEIPQGRDRPGSLLNSPLQLRNNEPAPELFPWSMTMGAKSAAQARRVLRYRQAARNTESELLRALYADFAEDLMLSSIKKKAASIVPAAVSTVSPPADEV